ncbi:hypothetical protein EMN47_05345 [Prolixibacteraceae bacterium JC049]|nr:hypothetical protein [Prolixibacteraceae bacterium JC049]
MRYQYINITRSDAIISIELNRPEKHNALNIEMVKELHYALDFVALDREISVVVLRGNGSSFCAGADISWFQSTLQLNSDARKEQFLLLGSLFQKLEAVPQPTIALIHGNTIGGGLGLIAACDFVLAASDTKMAFREVKLGIIPATIAPILIRKIGSNYTNQLMISGRSFSAHEGKILGLIAQVEDKEHLNKALHNLLNQMQSNSPSAMQQTKKLVKTLETVTPEQELSVCIDELAKAINSPDGKEGFSAFQEKRVTSWNNRQSVE